MKGFPLKPQQVKLFAEGSTATKSTECVRLDTGGVHSAMHLQTVLLTPACGALRHTTTNGLYLLIDQCNSV